MSLVMGRASNEPSNELVMSRVMSKVMKCLYREIYKLYEQVNQLAISGPKVMQPMCRPRLRHDAPNRIAR